MAFDNIEGNGAFARHKQLLQCKQYIDKNGIFSMPRFSYFLSGYFLVD